MPGFNINGSSNGEPDAKSELRRKHRWLFTAGFLSTGEYAYAKVSHRPQMKLEDAKMAHDQEDAHFAGRVSWETIDIEFYDAENPVNISGRIYEWLVGSGKSVFARFGVGGQVSVRKPAQYKSDIELIMIDGNGEHNEKWTLYNAWPEDIDWGDLNYESSDIATVKVKVRFDRAVRDSSVTPPSDSATILV